MVYRIEDSRRRVARSGVEVGLLFPVTATTRQQAQSEGGKSFERQQHDGKRGGAGQTLSRR